MNWQVNTHEEVEQWNDTVKEMRQDDEDTIHLIMPETFENKWIKNMEKKGKLVCRKYFSLLTLGASFNFFVSIDTSGGYMEWNIDLDKLIHEWLENFTPKSCIRVNIISMEMATNTNPEVARMIPCIKYIKNMRSDFYLLTKCLAGKAIGKLIQVKQLHSDATSHKVTEIMNLILGVLTNNKELRTICFSSDIIPEDGTAKCQSSGIVDQFTKCVLLIKCCCKKKI